MLKDNPELHGMRTLPKAGTSHFHPTAPKPQYSGGVQAMNMLVFTNRRAVAYAAIALGGLLCAALLMALLRREPPLDPVILLKRPMKTPITLRYQVLRWIPSGTAFNWARTLLLLGRRKQVSLMSEVFVLRDSTGQFVEVPLLGNPVFSNSEGTRIWFSSTNELKSFRRELSQSAGLINRFRSHVITADGTGATLFSGQTVVLQSSTNQVGLEIEYFPRVRDDKTDLFLGAVFSDLVTNDLATDEAHPVISVITNLNISTRLQLPKGKGVVLMTRTVAGSSVKSAGLLLDPP